MEGKQQYFLVLISHIRISKHNQIIAHCFYHKIHLYQKNEMYIIDHYLDYQNKNKNKSKQNKQIVVSKSSGNIAYSVSLTIIDLKTDI